MKPVVIFPDIELVVTTYLRTALASYGYPSVFVSNKRGTQTTAVWVRHDGGPALDQVRESARVGVNVYAPTEQDADDLARTVSALLVASPNGNPIVRAEQSSSPSGVAEVNGARRFMSFEFTVRGSDLAPTP